MSKPARANFPGHARLFPVVLSCAAAALLVASLKLPLWQMRLEAPQYRDEEAIKIAVRPDSYRGDLKELSVLNQYIGVHVPPTLPQFRWLPVVLVLAAALGVAASVLRRPTRPRALALVSCALAVALALAAAQAISQMHDIGHKRDRKTVLAGVKDFTPPFLGTNRIAQFTVRSRFGLGAWLIGGALALQLGAAWLSCQRRAGVSPAQGARERDPVCDVGFADGSRRDACSTLS